MTYLDRGIGISVVCVLLAGCTTNPWFSVDGDDSGSSGTATGSGGQGSTTGEVPTSGDPSAGTGSASGTTEGAEASGTSTGVTPMTTSVSVGSDPGESTAGPGTDTGTGTSGGDTDQEGSSSGGGDLCGNGVMDEGEQCDDGENAEDSACTPECKQATCGDGYTYTDGEEECDEGALNAMDSDVCTHLCQIPECGDEFTAMSEACDSGENNGAGKGFCSADCEAPVMVELEIRVTNATTLGALSKNDKQGVAAADEYCKTFGPNWKAMISDGMFRVASETGWSNVGQKTWVLLPYTAYLNANLGLIGVTGKDSLLGDPQTGALINTIGVVQSQVWTGLNDDWTSSEDNCDNWKSSNAQNKGVVGQALDKLDSYLRLDDVEGFCNTPRRLYCVQQPP